MAKLGLVLDCADPEALGGFWSAALAYTNLGMFGNYVVLRATEPGAPQLLLQRVEERKAGKNRMHFDVHVTDIEAETARLEALGARRAAPGTSSEHGTTWILMVDPEGNEFCVCDSAG